MLDLAKLAGQIPDISQHLQQEGLANRERLQRATELLGQVGHRQEELVQQLLEWRDRLIFTAATPIEPIDTSIPIPTPPKSHSVFATDGSQISPSHHEVTYCYLINIGRIMLHYGQGLFPLLDSIPEVFYKPEDIYISKQWGIRVEEWMGYRRTVSEAQMLAEMACRWVRPPGEHYHIPNLAMVDGSLIYWFLEALPQPAREQILSPILAAWEELHKTNIPLMGYVSASRSIEAVNFLRLPACPFDNPNCVVNCGSIEEKKECEVITPLRDTTVWGHLLKPGQRSCLWRSNSSILHLYDEPLRIYFCYVNVGSEVARIEVPAWVAEDKDLLNQSLGIMLAQVDKGYGYPITLAEAHNQAVVRGGDRASFFALLEREMIRAGIKNVGTSSKESTKRSTIA